MIKLDSELGKAIGFTSDSFQKEGSFIWDTLSSGYISVMRLNPVPGTDRPIANLIRQAERLRYEVRFYDFPESFQKTLIKSGFRKVIDKCGTSYIHNRLRLQILSNTQKAKN